MNKFGFLVHPAPVFFRDIIPPCGTWHRAEQVTLSLQLPSSRPHFFQSRHRYISFLFPTLISFLLPMIISGPSNTTLILDLETQTTYLAYRLGSLKHFLKAAQALVCTCNQLTPAEFTRHYRKVKLKFAISILPLHRSNGRRII